MLSRRTLLGPWQVGCAFLPAPAVCTIELTRQIASFIEVYSSFIEISIEAGILLHWQMPWSLCPPVLQGPYRMQAL